MPVARWIDLGSVARVGNSINIKHVSTTLPNKNGKNTTNSSRLCKRWSRLVGSSGTVALHLFQNYASVPFTLECGSPETNFSKSLIQFLFID